MPFLNVKNRAESNLAAGISNVDTSLTVLSGEGAKFPASNFHITIDDEILLCTSRSGDVFTVTRAQEGTTAASHLANAAVELRITAKLISDLNDEVTKSGFFTAGKRRVAALLFREMLSFLDFVNATVTANAGELRIWTSAIANAYAWLEALPYFLNFDKNMRCRIVVRRIVTSTNGSIRFWCNTSEGSDTVKHIGFKIIGSTVYATNANGTTETTTNITSQVTLGTGIHTWEWEFIAGSKINFYFDGTLVATHTTNLPSGAGGYGDSMLFVAVDNNADAVTNRFYAPQITAEVNT